MKAELVVEIADGFVFQLEPVLPFQARIFIEGKLRAVSADGVVNLPGDELRMVTERLGHGRHDAPGVIPISVAGQADGAPRALVFPNTMFVERQNFRMFPGEPDRGRGGWCSEDNLDVLARHDVHDAAQPEKIKLALLGFADAPGKFTHADDVDPGLRHQGCVTIPNGLRVLGGATVGEDPMFGIIINAKIHNLNPLNSTHSKSKMPRTQLKSHSRGGE